MRGTNYVGAHSGEQPPLRPQRPPRTPRARLAGALDAGVPQKCGQSRPVGFLGRERHNERDRPVGIVGLEMDALKGNCATAKAGQMEEARPAGADPGAYSPKIFK